MNPDLEWLTRRWKLPSDGEAAVEKLLETGREGSTALRLDTPPTDWGHAVGGEKSSAPLVAVQHGDSHYLQSRVLFNAERFIADKLASLARKNHLSGPASKPRHAVDEKLLRTLFPDAESSDPQRAAVRVALGGSLTLISGGPGTGKTYTLARILAAFAVQGLRAIRLAAPSGKAADRMKTSVGEALVGLPTGSPETREAVHSAAQSGSTLHSLLGFNPRTGRCRYHAGSPLPCEALIIDECSMVDVFLWKAVLEALPEECRLVLVGDPDQLESVGKGNIFAEVTLASRDPASLFAQCGVSLSRARRFRDCPEILEFAGALASGDADRAVALLKESKSSALTWIPAGTHGIGFPDFPHSIQEALLAVANAASPEEALKQLAEVCVLTPHRRFATGSLALAESIGKNLSREGHPPHHQPIIINHNDPETGLRNGSVGILTTEPDGKCSASFPDTKGGLRVFAPEQLPDFSPAWAITIHRSQGSEYRRVLVVLPHEGSPMATRELLYTAITRASQSVTVIGNLGVVRKAALTPSRRVSLLPYFISSGARTQASPPQMSQP